MANNIAFGSNFNPSSVFVPGLYYQIIPPQAYFNGVVSSIGAMDGTASWGDVDQPRFMSSPTQVVSNFGGITPAAVNDLHDLSTDLINALSQSGANNGAAFYGSRVTDGTDTAATLDIKTVGGTTIAQGVLKKTGSLGNKVTFTETAGNPGPDMNVTFTGTVTTGNVVDLFFQNSLFQNGVHTVKYTLVSGDSTLTLLATHIAAAINADAVMAAVGFTATSLGAVVTISWPLNLASVLVNCFINGTTTATIGGSATPADVVTIKIIDSSLPSGEVDIAYTVAGPDTLTLIATGLKNLINAQADLIAAGITATSSGAVISLISTSLKQTTYSSALSAGATESVTFTNGPTEVATLARIPSINVLLVPFAGGGATEAYNGLPGSPARYGPALKQAINQGWNSQRPASTFMSIPGAVTTVTDGPALGTFIFQGGTDGRGVSTAQLVGNPSATPPTGLFAFQKLTFKPSVAWVCGLTDSAGWALVQQYAVQNNVFCLLTFALNTNVDQDTSLKGQVGISNYQMGFVKNWCEFYDSVNQISRLVPPYAFAGGTIATLPPWESPLNKALQLVTATERNRLGGSIPYSDAELAQYGQAGIMVITNPIQAGPTFGFENGYNSVGNNDPTSFVEYSRMTNWIVANNDAVLGQFIGNLAGFSNTDNARSKIRAKVNSFFAPLKEKGYIADFLVQCDNSNNSQLGLAQHSIVLYEEITFQPSIQTIFTQIQGGTTVVIPNSGS